MNAWVCDSCSATSTEPKPAGWAQVVLWEERGVRRFVLCPKETDLAKIKKPK